jgi:hypothetical protein
MNMQIKIMSIELQTRNNTMHNIKHNNLGFHNTTKYTYLYGNIIHQLDAKQGCSTQL